MLAIYAKFRAEQENNWFLYNTTNYQNNIYNILYWNARKLNKWRIFVVWIRIQIHKWIIKVET